MKVIPIGWREAASFVDSKHRHHKRPQGWKWGIGAVKNGALVGVAMVGRPVSRHLDDGVTAEITRLCTDGTQNACSFLYGAVRRASYALGYQRVITYILEAETGASLSGAGFRLVGISGGGSWSRTDRPRSDKAPICRKELWEVRRS